MHRHLFWNHPTFEDVIRIDDEGIGRYLSTTCISTWDQRDNINNWFINSWWYVSRLETLQKSFAYSIQKPNVVEAKCGRGHQKKKREENRSAVNCICNTIIFIMHATFTNHRQAKHEIPLRIIRITDHIRSAHHIAQYPMFQCSNVHLWLFPCCNA